MINRTIDLKELQAAVQMNFPLIKTKKIDVSNLVFEEGIKLSCFYCGRYKNNWKCPPNIPNLDFKKITSEFQQAAFVWVDLPMNESNYAEVRSQSSVMLHRALLEMEKHLLNQGSAMQLSFIGGSCKLCKNGCGKEKCNNPYESRIPLEAVGVNIVKSARKYDIDIVFPVESHIIRLGLLLW